MTDAVAATPADTTAAPAAGTAPTGATTVATTAPAVAPNTTLTGQDTTDTGTATTQPVDKPAGTDQKDGTAKPAAEGDKDKGDKPAAGAPEKYEAFKFPEGVAIDPEDNTALEGFAKEQNLTQEQAQKVADLGAKQAQKFVTKLQEAQAARTAQWESDAKADKEFGGDKLEENLGVAKKFLDTFGSPELNQFLVGSGLGNHPELIRVMVKAGRAISQERFVSGGQSSAASTTPIADRLYKKPD